MLALVRRRFGRQFAVDPDGAERRLAGFLVRRGYDWETIGRVVREAAARKLAEEAHFLDTFLRATVNSLHV